MGKKKIIILLLIVLILSGCTKIDVDNYDEIITATMSREDTNVNTVSTGYELYIPVGVSQIKDYDNNQKFKIKNRYVYMYVDIVSYYYKNTMNDIKDNSDYNYYYKAISLNDKSGYVGINKIDDDSYFCEMVYNYTKIEFYSNLDDLSYIMANCLIIQNSIKFNDKLIETELEGTTSDNGEVTYELKKPKESDSSFSDYLQEYVEEESEEVELPD